jgi:cytochrome c peroxidase
VNKRRLLFSIFYLVTIIIFCAFFVKNTYLKKDTKSDLVISKIIKEYNLRPLPVRRFEADKKYLLGKALFYDPILSGNRDVACATCHLISRATTDAQPLALGTGGVGLGASRLLPGSLNKVLRNSTDLWNRDNNSVRSLFWDGRVEMIDPKKRIFRSPLNEFLPSGLDNTLAVQAIFPLLREDEMLGKNGDLSPNYLPLNHSNLVNEIAFFDAKTPEGKLKILSAIVNRLIGSSFTSELKKWQKEYRRLFLEAYPDIKIGEISIVEIANAIAHYEELAFATRNTSWDSYLAGNKNAITNSAKKGSIVFYGKGRCSICHSGPLFSDFEFHSLGLDPRTNIGGIEVNDLGRFRVTGDSNDKYKFRTPPLRNVSKTAPYFHNGSTQTLEQVVGQHIDPLYLADKYNDDGSFSMKNEQIESVSKVLTSQIRLTGEEINYLIEFLKSLDNIPSKKWLDDILPGKVPSGLPIPVVKLEG